MDEYETNDYLVDATHEIFRHFEKDHEMIYETSYWDESEYQDEEDPVGETLRDLVSEHGIVKVQNALDEKTTEAFLTYVGTDAEKWAKEFIDLFDVSLNLEVTTFWFANAIEAGRNAEESKHIPDQDVRVEDEDPYVFFRNMRNRWTDGPAYLDYLRQGHDD